MRSLSWLSCVGLAGLTACSGSAPGGNSVDVAAAASRGESDIANYAAAPAPAAAPVPEPGPSAPRETPTPATAASPPLASDAAPVDVLRRYFAAISDRRYGEAWRLWQGEGRASGMREEAFAASFARYATYEATIGTPGEEDAGAGQRYVTVPVTVTGTLRSGAPFRLEGPVILHKVADGIESDDPQAHAWRLRNSEMKPRPGQAGSSKD